MQPLPARRILPLLLLAAPLAAQNMPVPDGAGRLLQVFDLEVLRPASEPDEPRAPALMAAPPIAAEKPLEAPIAVFLREFVEPRLGPGDDVQVLASRWLCLLGSPAQLASAERLIAANQAWLETPVEYEVRIAEVPKKAFDNALRPRLQARDGEPLVCEAVVVAAEVPPLRTALEEKEFVWVAAPAVTALPLQRTSVTIQNQTAYIRDFTVARRGDELIADPVVDVVCDGFAIELCSTVLPDGRLGVHCDLDIKQLQRPIPTYETELAPGTTVKIQVPRTTGVRMQTVAKVASGDVIVLAGQKLDGDWIVAVVDCRLHKR